MRQTVFSVPGVAAPQGSKRHVGNGILVESSKKVKPWRDSVKATIVDLPDWPVHYDGPVEVKLRFVLPRPKGHFGTGRNSGTVKESAPAFPAVRPDVDKLARAVLDALTDTGLIADDSRTVSLRAVKAYTEYHPRCDVVIREAVE